MIKKLKIERTIFLSCLIICLVALTITGLDAKAAQAEIEELQYINSRQAARLKDKQEYIEMLEIAFLHMEVEEDLTQEELKMKYVGEFEITYYTAGPESTGKSPGHPQYGITASGTTVEEGRTIAADWDVLPVGTKVYIDGIGERTVEDTGGLIVDKCIDVYVEDVETALQGGRHMADVWMVDEQCK
ncbi:3D domain-containing protein [Sedimentibacter sp.]|uniref:3D domain-containing protein n=1 Tax=Sedimentibacter sp. TaxID=1960295 RepID=UPI0028AE2D6C|nr:3D domain-containing protein [Sedimentibacter sp.]